MSDIGTEFIAESLMDKHKLKFLRLNNNKISDVGFYHLAKAI